jgi:2-polyprenyl-6-methoxyphenol hydroxylase-like FAD-dependent oxidoreductase
MGGPGRRPEPAGGGVLIVGAGPTGLALACELARRGVACRIVEAAPARGSRSKALAIWPRTLEIMEDLGVAGAALERGLALSRGTIWSAGRRVAGFDLRGVASRYRHALVLPQYETEAILEGRLEQLGGRVERGTECLGVLGGEAGAVARLRTAGGVEHAAAGWVVGCDGPGSVVRHSAGISMPQRLEREGWLLADVIAETELEPSGVHYFLSRLGVLHMVPLPGRPGGQRWRVTLSAGPARPDERDWPAERIASVVADRAAVPVRVVSAEGAGSFRVRQGLAREFRRGPVLLAGDAAHVHSPAGGQGINAGLQDAANLGWKLARVCAGLADSRLLDSYGAERRPAARAVVRATDRATRAGTMTGRLGVAARDRLWQLADRRGVIDRRVAPLLAGLAQRYPGALRERGPAAAAAHRAAALAALLRAGRPAVGARLPNIAAGQGWLWDELPPDQSAALVFAGPGGPGPGLPDGLLPAGTPVVLVAPDGRQPQPGWRVLADPGGRACRELGVSPGTILVVRPDRYIAACCQAGRPEPIREYFRAVGGTACRAPET